MTEARGLHPADKVEAYVSKGWWSDRTIDRVFRDQVAAQGDRTAVVDPANLGDLVGAEPRRLTWSQLDSEVTHLAAQLLEMGLSRGDVIGVQIPNSIELVKTYLAAWSIGVVMSPLPMPYREREVVGAANQAGFKAIVTVDRFGDRQPLAEVTAAREAMPTVSTVVVMWPDASSASTSAVNVSAAEASDDDRSAVEARRTADPADPNDCVTVCWTSGTESEPKGVPRCHYDWIAISQACLDAPELTSADVVLNPFPMVNMAAIGGVLIPWLLSGSTLVQHQPFDVPTFLGQVARERVTYTLVPPALLTMLLHNDALMSQVDLSSITRIGSGSVPLQPAMVRGWQEKHGISIINFFGSNEGTALLSSPQDFPDPEDRALYFPNYGAEGVTWSTRIADAVSVRLVDLVSGEDITEQGRVGELRLNGPTVFAGYLNPENNAAAFDELGYLRTGDLFEIAGERGEFLRYVDRAKDVINRGGMKVSAAEMEALISAHPSVMEAAVIGDSDEVMGERVAAVVTLKPESTLTLEELVDFLRSKKIASYKLPERLDVREELPRNPVGKILKRELRQGS
ncbi:class I adenylate-forming enzyme family protein [Intrasporangium sp.]|uniref:class I adenylate-forming enzyme family protein n=1 Tax=Intrasporangium sp. TaxID=1925024 RepID=UPI00293AFF5C|nr:class I adenylate-forming enzyme family protein [Intrasporangium sp.]MDV3220456.1 acyl--CoA ligase [Intrasporangium sp.]